MQLVEVDGVRSRLQRQGSGSPLVYLHSGFGEAGPLPVFGEFAGAGFEVFAPELPGFGRSDPPSGWHRVEDAVFHLRRILDVLGLERVTMVGSSLGGWLAAEVAVWFPERVGALVLLDSLGLRVEGAPVFEIFGSPQHEVWRRALPGGGDLPALIRPALEDGDDPNAVLVHLLHAMEAQARIGWNPYLHDPALARRLHLVGAPTLVVWGAEDGIVPLAHGEAYAAAIPGARLVVLDGCGHLPALERPAAVASLVADFVRETTGTRW
jgi:pimeloyl-ACP methyl ester carboxylesterase